MAGSVIEIGGLPIPDHGPLFLAFLGIHVAAGLWWCVVTGAPGGLRGRAARSTCAGRSALRQRPRSAADVVERAVDPAPARNRAPVGHLWRSRRVFSPADAVAPPAARACSWSTTGRCYRCGGTAARPALDIARTRRCAPARAHRNRAAADHLSVVTNSTWGGVAALTVLRRLRDNANRACSGSPPPRTT